MMDSTLQMPVKQSVPSIDTSSSINTSNLMSVAALPCANLAKPSLVRYALSNSNRLCIVVAATSVFSISMMAAAIPVGADAADFFLCTRHHR